MLLAHYRTDIEKHEVLQAAVAGPAAVGAKPTQLTLGLSTPSAVVAIDGPHVRGWTATTKVP